jgi:hypothetical protein
VTDARQSRRVRRAALGIFAALVLIYNANGREIGSVDTQPQKFTAQQIALRHTLVLDAVVAERPLLADRPAFAQDRAGHFRSAYPILPALLASVPALLLQTTGLVDMNAALAPNLVAALTASVLTAAAVALIFLAVSRLVPPRVAWLTAAAIGLGTGYWTSISQTLWQHETVAFGLALALWAWLRPGAEIGRREAWLGGLGLALAGAARPQVAPIVATMLGWMAARAGVRRAVLPAAIVGAAAAICLAANYHWFGHPLGDVWRLEAVHPQTHHVAGVVSVEPWTALAGLLVSPSRGLLVFSPALLVALAGIGPAWNYDRGIRLGWLLGGVAVELLLYSWYSVWWGGHTYGPRYALDLLVPLAPALALGLGRAVRTRRRAAVVAVLLVWSMAVAGAGAFIYPNDAWNSLPNDIDTHHDRLWTVRDSQIPRTLHSGLSPQDFDLFTRAAVR